MAFGIVEGISAAIALWGGSQQHRAQKRALQKQLDMLRPFLAARAAMLETQKSKLGRPSSRLKAAYETSLARLTGEVEAAGRMGEGALARRGREGGPGVRWGTRLAGESAAGELTLGYAGAEEERQLGIEESIERLTRGVLPMSQELTGAEMSLEGEKWGAVSDVLGGVLGDVKTDELIKALSGTDEKRGPGDVVTSAEDEIEREVTSPPRPGVDLRIPVEADQPVDFLHHPRRNRGIKAHMRRGISGRWGRGNPYSRVYPSRHGLTLDEAL